MPTLFLLEPTLQNLNNAALTAALTIAILLNQPQLQKQLLHLEAIPVRVKLAVVAIGESAHVEAAPAEIPKVAVSEAVGYHEEDDGLDGVGVEVGVEVAVERVEVEALEQLGDLGEGEGVEVEVAGEVVGEPGVGAGVLGAGTDVAAAVAEDGSRTGAGEEIGEGAFLLAGVC